MKLPPQSRARVAVERAILEAVLRLPARALERMAKRRAAAVDGRAIDRQAAVLLALDDMFHQGEVAGRTAESARRKLAEGQAVVDQKPRGDVRVEPTRVAGGIGERPARLYVPDGIATPSPLIVFFHGGGWVAGDLDTHDTWCRGLAAGARARVLSVDYRRAPEDPFPSAIDDGCAAFRDAAKRAQLFGADPSRIALMGDSAGGNLSAVIARKTAHDPIKPALQVLVYPAVDATRTLPSHRIFRDGYFLTEASIDWYLGCYAPGVDARHPDLSPLFAPDDPDLPPALVFTAGFDPLRDEGAAYAEKLRASGVRVHYQEWPSLFHGFTVMTHAVAAAREATYAITDAVRAALHSV